MEINPTEAKKNLSHDFLILDKTDIDKIPIFKIGDGKVTSLEKPETELPQTESLIEELPTEPIIVIESDDEYLGLEPEVIRKIMIHHQNPYQTAFVSKVWTAFLTFYLFVIPAMIGLILGMLATYGNPEIGYICEDVKHLLTISFLAVSVMVGLPLHMLALADLEDAVQDAMYCKPHLTSSGQLEIKTDQDFDYQEVQ